MLLWHLYQVDAPPVAYPEHILSALPGTHMTAKLAGTMYLPLLSLLVLHLLSPVQALPKVILTTLNYTGKGCPSGSIYSSILQYQNRDPHNSTFLWTTIDRFQPFVGPGISPRDSVQNCSIYFNVSFSEPQWKLWVNQNGMDVRGYSPMDTGTTLTVRAWYEWVDIRQQVPFKSAPQAL